MFKFCFTGSSRLSITKLIITQKRLLSIAFMVVFLPSLVTLNTGCGSSKKAKAKAAEEARMAKEKADRIKREEADKKRREEDEKQRALREPIQKMEDYFSKVSTASNVDNANAAIDQAMNMFSSPEAPVLIVIKKTGDIIDYDRPTTARQYFDYLKDQKKTFNKVDKLEFDEKGKIKEMILITQ